MKLFYQTIVFFFLALSLFIVRDDVVSVINQVYSDIHKTDEITEVNYVEKEEVQLPKKVDMPGPLRVVGDILKKNDNSQLSKDNLIILTNKERIINGNLSELKENKLLDLSAEKKLEDMFNNQYFEHESPTGAKVENLVAEVVYEYILIGENLAMGNFVDDESLIKSWMDSLGHRENILNENYTEIGIAVGRGKFEGVDIWMAVQHFGTPRSICPVIDDVLLGTINLNQEKIKEMESDLLRRKEMIDREVVYEGSTYSEQINQYNDLIIPYNDLIKEIKIEINNYNEQVRAFNDCLLKQQ